MSQTPTLPELLRTILDAQLNDIHISMPARVETYDASKLSVNVQPLIKRAFTDEAGDRQTEAFPVIPNVPLIFPGAGAYRITFPVKKGDLVTLLIAEASLDKWLETESVVDPLDDRRNMMIDAQAIPGLRSFKSANGANEDALVIDVPSGGEMRLGSESATDPVALKSDLDAIKTFFEDQFDTAAGHTHSGAGAGPPVSGTGSGTGFTIPSLPGATKVKGE